MSFVSVRLVFRAVVSRAIRWRARSPARTPDFVIAAAELVEVVRFGLDVVYELRSPPG
jgi:hypothetical protein